MVRHFRWRVRVAGVIAAFSSIVAAQTPSLQYPRPRQGDTVDNYFGTTVADPYRWMEDLNSAELKQWIDAENARPESPSCTTIHA
ncbi:MAG: hypothetical protein DMF98_11695 [Acidobacteria bacterium]|nr:MAG: hypothetical protein DMF98_11695 [Acidobacteriota bacterium]